MMYEAKSARALCRLLQVAVHIQLAAGGLTKIVTFTPYYMIINQAQVCG